ncbi:MAG: PDZ domain-containing protein [Candidatus Omnitrophica bacterium]|nr:PDZ domain-containing protein [Candidatus Omnitrophota bacterium]
MKNIRKKFLILLVLTGVVYCMVTGVRAENGSLVDGKKDLFSSIQLFADALSLISTDYVESVEARDLVYGAIEGMMGKLDDYSQFLDQESFREITEETKGEFGGIGIEVGMREGILTVISPIKNTPAAKVGLEKNDKIIKIDGELTRGLTLSDAVNLLKGDPGTRVTLSVYRKGEKDLKDFRITRAVIKLESIKDVSVIADGISYINLVEFQERTAKDLRETLNGLSEKDVQGVILDLRDNPGGLLNASIDVADLFLPQGALIVYTEGRDPGKRAEFRSKKISDFDGMDLALLVNKRSASASEILAGAVKDNGRGLVIGETTYGKGSVQTVIPLKDKSALRLTTASYFTPSGKSLRNTGIDPDIYVKRVRRPEREKGRKKEDLFQKLAAEGKIELPDDEDAGDEEEKDGKSDRSGLKHENVTVEVKDMPLLEDNQIKAAFDILKGIKLSRKASVRLPEEKTGESGGAEDGPLQGR